MALLGLVATGVVVMALVCTTTGCGTVGYLAQSTMGHVAVMSSAKPVSEWLQDETTPEPLRQRLATSQRMRDFAVSELKLPDNQSYRRYADLGRTAAVWNVVAAPALSLKLKSWCFPVVGCVGYRGYYREADAQALATELAKEGWEVSVYPVPAYSTLGKLEWLGGDPLLNTFVNLNEGDLARLMFHELSHQVSFAPGDTTFNESFATAVERLGGARWLTQHAPPGAQVQMARRDAMRAEFRDLVSRHRTELEAVYAGSATDQVKQQGKLQIMARMRAAHQTLKQERWGGSTAYDTWFAGANNALLGIMASYNEWVPAFEVLFHQQGQDFGRFYAEVKRLADLSPDERRATLARLMPR